MSYVWGLVILAYGSYFSFVGGERFLRLEIDFFTFED